MVKQQLSTNTFTVAKWVVSADPTQGTHTTIGGALAVAVAGDTIFIRDGTYIENPILVAGVDLVAFEADGQTPNVIIDGTCTLSTAGTVSISGICLQTNNSFALTISGSAASFVNLINCNINCLNFTGISFSSSSASAAIILYNCRGNLGTTGIGLFSCSSPGSFQIYNSNFGNSGGSSLASTSSATAVLILYSIFIAPLATSATGSLNMHYCELSTAGQNAVTITTAGTGSSVMEFCECSSGSASTISVGAGTTVTLIDNVLNSANTNVITGAGTIITNPLGNVFTGTSTGVNTTTSLFLQEFGVAPVNNGGTGNASQAANSLVAGGTTTTGAFQSIAPVATGQVLISSGTGALPVFSATPTLTSVTFGSGTALSVYQEGTWTPTLVGTTTAGTTSYTSQHGYYTKIGNMVTIWGFIGFSAATGTGAALLGGFPFTVKNQIGYAPSGPMLVSVGTLFVFPAGTTYLTLTAISNTVTANIYASGSGSGGGSLQMANTTGTFEFTLTYQV